MDKQTSDNIRYGHWKTGEGPFGKQLSQYKHEHQAREVREARNSLPRERI